MRRPVSGVFGDDHILFIEKKIKELGKTVLAASCHTNVPVVLFANVPFGADPSPVLDLHHPLEL